MNPDGSAYRGVVEIAKVRETFRVKWTLDDSAVMGVGIYSNNILAVSYFGGAPAVVVYRSMSMEPSWWANGRWGSRERFTQKPSPKPPPRRPLDQPRRQEPGRQERNRPLTPAAGVQL